MTYSRRYTLFATALLALSLAAALPAAASASYEQVGCFAGQFPGLTESCKPKPNPGEPSSEEVQLGGVAGLAVNRTGAGGVPPGTVYAVVESQLKGPRVAMFEPSADGGLAFHLAWQIFSLERCGAPAMLPACAPYEGDSNAGILDVEVDQSTGAVYVLQGYDPHAPLDGVKEYTPDGSEVITEFAEFAPETLGGVTENNIDKSPEDLHFLGNSNGGLALDQSTGDVYVYDRGTNDAGEEFARIMVFEPATPGDYAHYVYAGRGHDVWAGINGAFPSQPRNPVTDDAGHLYIASEQYVAELDTSDPSGPPLCTFAFRTGGIDAITVDPQTGEVFFYSYRDRKIHRLAPCSAGAFQEAGSLSVAPERGEIFGLAFDPAREVDLTRAPGALYAAAISGASIGGGEPGQSSLGYIFALPSALPPSVESESVTHVTASTALLHAQINPHANPTRYAFQYLDQATYDAQKALAEGEGKSPEEVQRAAFAGASQAPLGGALLGEGTKTLPAAVALTGLQPDTAYRFRVVASSFCNSEEPEVPCESSGPSLPFHTYPSEPPGLPDHRAYELVSPAQKHGGQVFPADPTRSSCEFSECKPGSFSSYPGFPYLASADGEQVAYRGSAFSFTEGALEENQYLARRTGSGWQTVDPTPALLLGGTLGGAYAGFGPELDDATLFQGQGGPALSTAAPAGYQDIYAQTTLAPPFALTPLLTEAPPDRPTAGPEPFELRYAGASEDLSRVFFEANDALTQATANAPAASDGGAEQDNLYEWHAGALKLVNVDPGNATAEPGAAFPRTGHAQPALIPPEATTIAASAISTDGSRAFWQGADGQLYLRQDAERTVEVSASQRAIEDPAHSSATFLAASADGTRALFSSSQELTEDADTGPLSQEILLNATAGTYKLGFEGEQTAALPYADDATQVQAALEALPKIGAGNVKGSAGKNGPVITFSGALAANQTPLSADGAGLTGTVSLRAFRPGTDLYLWHEGALTDLSAGPEPGEFRGLIGASEDLSHVYFVDGARLDGTANEHGELATAHANNLYLYHEGAIRFIAQYNPDGQNLNVAWTATTSPNGRWLAFRSKDPLTGFDNTGPCGVSGGAIATGPCGEIFLYDSATELLTCPSCNPSGAAPLGSSSLPVVNTAAAQRPLHFVTDSGRLYFDSQDSLVPADTNEGAEDVYEYEPAGAGAEGTCERQAGCVLLISAGRNHADSNLAAISADGRDVFFTTWDQLSLRDKDDLMDLYDAREGGGLPVETEVASPECQGEACQGTPVPPVFATPGSVTFSGAGNATAVAPVRRKSRPETRCVKPRKLVRGRCAKPGKKKAKPKRRTRKAKRQNHAKNASRAAHHEGSR